MNDEINEMEEQLSFLEKKYEEKIRSYRKEMKAEGRDHLTKEQSDELNKDLAEISSVKISINRKKANQDFQNKATCISNNPKTPLSELQNVTDTSQTN